MSDLSFVRNVIETLPSLVEMARLHPDMSHEEVAAHWLAVPSSYRVPESYTSSMGLVAALDAVEDKLAELQAAYDVQKAATCQLVIASATEYPQALDAGMVHAVKQVNEQRRRADDAEAERDEWHEQWRLACATALDQQTKHAKQEAELHKYRTEESNNAVLVEEYRAELAALKARRCEGCLFTAVCFAQVDSTEGPIAVTSCSRWTAREDGES